MALIKKGRKLYWLESASRGGDEEFAECGAVKSVRTS